MDNRREIDTKDEHQTGRSVWGALAIAVALSLLLAGLLVAPARASFRKSLDVRGRDGRSIVLDEPR